MEGVGLANRFFWAHWISTILFILLFPREVGIPEKLGIPAAEILGYSWIANVDGVLPVYPDIFLLSWMLLPLWLIAFAALYWRLPYQVPHTSTSPWVILISAIALIAFFALVDVDVSDNTGRGSVLLIVAAKSQLLGAPVFGTAVTASFFICFAAFVKIPIDALKRPAFGARRR
jgi:hypothetical protein